MPSTANLPIKGLSNESFLLLGEPGSGKTNFLRHMPKPMYVFDFDNGIKTLAGVQGIEYDVYKDAPPKYTGKMSEGVYKWGTAWVEVRKKVDALTAEFAAGKGPKVVALDSLTGMMELAKDSVMLADPGKTLDNMEIQHWGALIMQVRYVLDTFTTWPCLKVAIGHVKRDENPLTEVMELVPLLQGQSQGTVPSYFDEIYFCDVVSKPAAAGGTKQQIYTLTTQKNGFVKAARSRRNLPNGTPNDWREVEKFLIGEK